MTKLTLNPSGAAPVFAGPLRVDDGVRDARILIIDDEPSNTRLLERLLRRAGFGDVHAAHTPAEALMQCTVEAPDILLLDVHMQGSDGIELLGELREQLARNGEVGLIPVIVITGDPSGATRERAERAGAGDYMTKPFDLFELVLRVESLLALRFLHADVSAAADDAQAAGELGPIELGFIERLVEVSQYYDGAPLGHNDRVGTLSRELAVELGVAPEAAASIGSAARLHDIGKIGVRDEILQKPGRLSSFEIDLARRHTVVGGLMLSGSRLPLLRLAEEIALTHHERWDGHGYPTGLAGEDIPLSGRIVAVADVFDALTHERPYKAAWSLSAAVAEIGLQRGTQFDPDVVDAFLRIAQRGELCSAEDGPADAGNAGELAELGSGALVRARRELRRLGLVGSTVHVA